MAIIKAGPIIGDIRGSIGGQTFSRNRFGAYSRQRVIPVNPATTRQENVRAAMSQLQERFRNTLTQAQKDGWKAYASETPLLNKLGDQILPTAINMFLRANVINLLAGNSAIDDAPSTPGIAAIPVLTFTGTAAAGISAVAPSPVLAAGDVLQYQISPAKPFSVNFFKGPFNSTVYADSGDTFPLELVPAASTSIGQRWFIQARFVAASGAASGAFLYRVDITS